jgi:hypothetical protein
LYERAVEVLTDDPRVSGVEVAGSIAAGTADSWSDLDVHVIAHVAEYDAFLGNWPSWLGAITPTVFARSPIAPFILNTLTPDGLTFDVAVFSGQAPVFPPPSSQYAVGLLSSRRFNNLAEALEYAVAEQLRGLAGPFISLIQREEHVRHLTGLPHILGLLTTVFLAETRAAPLGKHWNATLTAEQRDAVGALPPLGATRDGVMGFGLGLAELLVERARPLYDRYGLEWPAALCAVTAARLATHLDVDVSAWLY